MRCFLPLDVRFACLARNTDWPCIAPSQKKLETLGEIVLFYIRSRHPSRFALLTDYYEVIEKKSNHVTLYAGVL